MACAFKEVMACRVVLHKLPVEVVADKSAEEPSNASSQTRPCLSDQDRRIASDLPTSVATDRNLSVTKDLRKTGSCNEVISQVQSGVQKELCVIVEKLKETNEILSQQIQVKGIPSNSEGTSPSMLSNDVATGDMEVNSKIRKSRLKNVSVPVEPVSQKGLNSDQLRHLRPRKRASSVEWNWSGKQSTCSNKVPQDKCRNEILKRKRTPSVDYELDCRESDSDHSFTEATNKCEICKREFRRPWMLRNHRRQHIDPSTRPFACSSKGCNKAYFNKAHLERHKSRSHSDLVIVTNVACSAEKCGKIFTSGSGLKRHYKKMHMEENLKFKCPSCDKYFSKHKQLRYHMAEHDGQAPLRCDICKVGFFSDRVLKRHKRRHRTFPCKVPGCEQVLQNYSAFMKHTAEHNRCFNTLRCAHCNKKFSTKFNLRTHVMTHIDSKPVFKCSYDSCPRFYYQEKNLKAHIRVRHEKVSNFMCDKSDCDKVFQSKRALLRHLSVHENGKAPITKRKEGPKARRKDAGKPRRSMAGMLTGVTVPRQVEKELLGSGQDVKFSESETEIDTTELVVCTDFGIPVPLEMENKETVIDQVETQSVSCTTEGSLHTKDQEKNALDGHIKEMGVPCSEALDRHSEELSNKDLPLQDYEEIKNLAKTDSPSETACIIEENVSVISDLVGKVFEVADGGILVPVDEVADGGILLSVNEVADCNVLNAKDNQAFSETQSQCKSKCSFLENEHKNRTKNSIGKSRSENADFTIKTIGGTESNEMQLYFEDLKSKVGEGVKEPEAVMDHAGEKLYQDDTLIMLNGDESLNHTQVLDPSSSSINEDTCTLSATLCAETIVDLPSSYSEQEVLFVIPKAVDAHSDNIMTNVVSTDAVIKVLEGDVEVYSVAQGSQSKIVPPKVHLNKLYESALPEVAQKISLVDPSLLNILQPLMQNLGNKPAPCEERMCSVSELSSGCGVNKDKETITLTSNLIEQEIKELAQSATANEEEHPESPESISNTDKVVSEKQIRETSTSTASNILALEEVVSAQSSNTNNEEKIDTYVKESNSTVQKVSGEQDIVGTNIRSSFGNNAELHQVLSSNTEEKAEISLDKGCIVSEEINYNVSLKDKSNLAKEGFKEQTINTSTPIKNLCSKTDLLLNSNITDIMKKETRYSVNAKQGLMINPAYVSARVSEKEVKNIPSKCARSGFLRKHVNVSSERCPKKLVRNPACIHAVMEQLTQNPQMDTSSHPFKSAKKERVREYLQGPTKEISESDNSSLSESDHSPSENSGSDDDDVDYNDEDDLGNDNASDDGNGGNEDEEDEDDEDEEGEEQTDEEEENDDEEDDNDNNDHEENGNNLDPGQINGENDDNNNGNDGNFNSPESGRQVDHDVNNGGEPNLANGSDCGVDRKHTPTPDDLSDSSGSDNLIIAVDNSEVEEHLSKQEDEACVSQSQAKGLLTSRELTTLNPQQLAQKNCSGKSHVKIHDSHDDDSKYSQQNGKTTAITFKNCVGESENFQNKPTSKICKKVPENVQHLSSAPKLKMKKSKQSRCCTQWETTDSSDNEPLINLVKKYKKMSRSLRTRKTDDPRGRNGDVHEIKLQGKKRKCLSDSRKFKRIKVRLIEVESSSDDSDFEPVKYKCRVKRQSHQSHFQKREIKQRIQVIDSDEDDSNETEFEFSSSASESSIDSRDLKDPTWKPSKKGSSYSWQESSASSSSLADALNGDEESTSNSMVSSSSSYTDSSQVASKDENIKTSVLKSSISSGLACRQLSEKAWIDIFRGACRKWKLLQTAAED